MPVNLVRWNDHGTGWKSPADLAHRFSELRVYAEGGHVQVWAEFRLVTPQQNPEALQYLEPWEAVRIGLGFIRCAFWAVVRRR